MSTALSRPVTPGPQRTADTRAVAAATSSPSVERVGADCYVVLEESRPVGYIDVAGTVYVALWGRRYDRAVEVGQTRALAAAAALVLREHQAHRRHGRSA